MARSCVGVKFKSMAQGICELLWLRSLMKELKIANEDLQGCTVTRKKPLALFTT